MYSICMNKQQDGSNKTEAGPVDAKEAEQKSGITPEMVIAAAKRLGITSLEIDYEDDDSWTVYLDQPRYDKVFREVMNGENYS